MLKDLLCLVDAHAHVTTLAPDLTQRVIETLAKELAHSLLRAFSQIHEMGLGAMLSVGIPSHLSSDKGVDTNAFVSATGYSRGGIP